MPILFSKFLHVDLLASNAQRQADQSNNDVSHGLKFWAIHILLNVNTIE